MTTDQSPTTASRAGDPLSPRQGTPSRPFSAARLAVSAALTMGALNVRLQRGELDGRAALELAVAYFLVAFSAAYWLRLVGDAATTWRRRYHSGGRHLGASGLASWPHRRTQRPAISPANRLHSDGQAAAQTFASHTKAKSQPQEQARRMSRPPPSPSSE